MASQKIEPEFLERMIQALKDEWKIMSVVDILRVDYLGPCDIDDGEYNLLVTGLQEGVLAFFIETVGCEKDELGLESFDFNLYGAKRLTLECMNAIKSLNYKSLEVLYGKKE